MESIYTKEGEIYQAGQQITVKWGSCNVQSTSKVTMTLKNVGDSTIIYLTDDKNIPAIFSTNDGTETFTIPTSAYSGIKTGNYNLSISTLASNGITDIYYESNIFKITAPVAHVCPVGCTCNGNTTTCPVTPVTSVSSCSLNISLWNMLFQFSKHSCYE
ncbi:MAG TPA: hypothetical protein VMR49_01200 [Candidatus Paceibacterota bacterium]|nr:hypothetical protein [Candidatus Paceibacterota bacterium]